MIPKTDSESRMSVLPGYLHLVVQNSIFTCLLSSSGQEWQFHMSTDILWPRIAIAHVYSHLVVMHGNFILLLTCSGKEWQFHMTSDISWSRMAMSYVY